jgi:hypothetical protein
MAVLTNLLKTIAVTLRCDPGLLTRGSLEGCGPDWDRSSFEALAIAHRKTRVTRFRLGHLRTTDQDHRLFHRRDGDRDRADIVAAVDDLA